MAKRGRRSIAAVILEEGPDSGEEGCFLVVYDFNDMKPNLHFYKNLKVITENRGDIKKLKNSIVQCETLKTARAVEKLATHYDATSLVFKAEQI